jgi:UDP-N-acetylmuramate--alanine ligase
MAAGYDPTAVIGGRLSTRWAWPTRAGARATTWSRRPTKADGSFLLLSPTMALLTNIDAEHLDHYGTVRERWRRRSSTSCNKVPFYGAAVLCLDQSRACNG